MTSPWRSVDPFGEGLHLLRLAGTFYCRSEFTAPWALELPDCLMLHGVTSSECRLEVAGTQPNRVGYESEAAFSRAFKRLVGVSPGAVNSERQ